MTAAVAPLELEAGATRRSSWAPGGSTSWREVLAHWVELGTWWTARGGAAGASPRRPSARSRRRRCLPFAGPRSWPSTSARSSARCGGSRRPVGRATLPVSSTSSATSPPVPRGSYDPRPLAPGPRLELKGLIPMIP